MANKPGSKAKSRSARSPIIDQKKETPTVAEESDVTTSTQVPGPEATPAPEEGAAIDQGASEASPSDAPSSESVTLSNGVTISDDTVMQCGRCGARFYAKDAPDGSCPATGQEGGMVVTCGGTLGPVLA